ncbi:unnamed protein product [Cutaneotrichosporon oleaginosum]
MGTMGAYQIVQELGRHDSDIKTVVSLDGGMRLACGARDGLVSVWTRQSGDVTLSPYAFEAEFRGHEAYVNSLAHIPSKDGESGGWLASGGNSTMILIHSLDTLLDEPTTSLIGHTHNVCALHYCDLHKLLASSSWDCTARIWKCERDDWRCHQVLEGHQQAVWDVKIVDIASRSSQADGEIRLWNAGGEAVQRFKCCPEPVRSISLLSTGELASASNDSIIRIWSNTGEVIASLSGHKDYIYQVIAMRRGMISCGEDKTAIAVLSHPCTSVWSVTSTHNGLVVTGGSDGIVRVWQQSAPCGQEKRGPASAFENADVQDNKTVGGVDQVVIEIDIASAGARRAKLILVRNIPRFILWFGQVVFAIFGQS